MTVVKLFMLKSNVINVVFKSATHELHSEKNKFLSGYTNCVCLNLNN